MAERDPMELQQTENLETVSVPDAEQAADGVRKKRRKKVVLALAAAKIAFGAGA